MFFNFMSAVIFITYKLDVNKLKNSLVISSESFLDIKISEENQYIRSKIFDINIKTLVEKHSTVTICLRDIVTLDKLLLTFERHEGNPLENLNNLRNCKTTKLFNTFCDFNGIKVQEKKIKNKNCKPNNTNSIETSKINTEIKNIDTLYDINKKTSKYIKSKNEKHTRSSSDISDVFDSYEFNHLKN